MCGLSAVGVLDLGGWNRLIAVAKGLERGDMLKDLEGIIYKKAIASSTGSSNP